MSFEAFAPPPPGRVVAVVPGPGADMIAALSPVLAEATAMGRDAAIAPADVAGSSALTVSAALRCTAPLPTGAAREAWLRPMPELTARLDRPWRELDHAERYLAGVARARLGASDLLVLETPASRLGGPRVLRLVQDLAAEGCGILWIERRLRLVACFEIEAWLVDDGTAIGPLPAPALLDDPRAHRLCFGGTLAE